MSKRVEITRIMALEFAVMLAKKEVEKYSKSDDQEAYIFWISIKNHLAAIHDFFLCSGAGK